MWIYDLMDHLMIELENTIALATITYILKPNLDKLHPMDEQLSKDFINDK